ncbi:nitroreductase family protein [Candidatus Fermentibacterales bacterium]|nr:nitroreductase family protein [Candidatus Fermentibacterales bacterium]
MNAIESIAARTSIRKFRSDPVPEESLRAILLAATQAPSGKNKQPWRFVVVGPERRQEMIRVMREGIARRKADGVDTGSAEWTANSMEQAPVTVFVYYPDGSDAWEIERELYFLNVVDIQSIGAAIQNMLLAARELGLGSLWICDVFYAYGELKSWMGASGEMIAAVSLGYPDESPAPRPRMSVDEVTAWL